MKGNIKKLAVFVIITAIAMFMTVGMASAGDYLEAAKKKTIHGTYAITGSGNCFIAINGFNTLLQPNDAMWVWGPLTYDGGFITFKKDGTGTFEAIFHAFDSWSPTFPGTPPPDMGAANETWNFTYTMTDNNNISITYAKGTYELDFTSGPNVGTPLGVSYIILPPVKGVISSDQKILNASFGAPDILVITADKANDNPTPTQAICNVVLQGILIRP